MGGPVPPKSSITLSGVKTQNPQESPTEWQMPHGAEGKHRYISTPMPAADRP